MSQSECIARRKEEEAYQGSHLREEGQATSQGMQPVQQATREDKYTFSHCFLQKVQANVHE